MQSSALITALLTALLVIAPPTAISSAAPNPDGSQASLGTWSYEAHLITIGPGLTSLETLGRSLLAVGRIRPGRIENVVYELGQADTEIGMLEYLSGRAVVRTLRLGTVTRALGPFLRAGRSAESQRLRLLPGELERLRAALEAELQPARQAYATHPLGETAASRVRDLLDSATGGVLRRGLASRGRSSSTRELLRLEVAGDLWAELLLDLFGGRVLDQDRDAYSALFLPRRLQESVAAVKRDGAPLAEASKALGRAASNRQQASHPAERIGWLWAAAMLVMGVAAWWRAPASPRLAGAWLLAGPVLLGLIGLAQLWLTLRAATAEARSNELVLVFAFSDATLVAVAWRWLKRRAVAGRLLLGYALVRVGLVALVIAGHLGGVLFQRPRALLVPAVVEAAVLLALVTRIRAIGNSDRQMN